MGNRTHKDIERILLIGAGFRNKGAEAMATTAIQRLSRIYPRCRITLASYPKKETRPYGEHSMAPLCPGEVPIRFELIKNTKKLSHLLRVVLWPILRFEKVRSFLTRGETYLQRFSQADLVVDLSGFAMTDHRSLVRRLVYCFEILTGRCFRKPFVIFTQAMGPFRKLSTRLAAQFFLPRVDLLIARGQSTREYLKEIGIDRKMPIPVCSDSAFLFEPTDSEMEVGKALLRDALAHGWPLFGIVPNSNIFRLTNPKNERNPYIQMLVCLCDHVHSALRARVVFVCHERYEYRKADEWLMQQVIRQAEVPDAIVAIDANHTAGELKAVIGQLDFVAASRFHSLVAAISAGTPFFAVGWAHKYAELAGDAGVGDSVLDFQGLSVERLLEAIEKAWGRREETRKWLEAQHDRLCASAERAYRLVAEKWPGRPT